MKKLNWKSSIFITIIVLVLLLSACSNKSAGVPKASEKGEKGKEEVVTIKVAFPLNEEYFNGRFGEVDKKLENIKLEHVPYDGTVEALEELFAKKENPDIIIGGYSPIEELEIGYPLDDLIEQFDFDLERLDPSLLSLMRSFDEEGRVAAFPDGGSFFALYYNKDVFDKLGEDYPNPDEPMTWGELMDLTKKLTREVGGQQYIGLEGGPGASFAELAAKSTDPDTGEVLVATDPAFKKYFELMEEYYNIPGINGPDLPESPFVEEQTAAMTIASNNYFSWGWGGPDPEKIHNIDMAPIPVWEDQPNTTPAKDAWPMVIAEYSEHKEEAFQVLTTYLDPEIQIGMAKTMMLQTPLIDAEILKHYGEDVPTYEGKNIEAYFFGEAAKYDGKQSNWDQYVDLGEAERRIKEDNIDVITVLRELAEEADGKIKSAMGGQ